VILQAFADPEQKVASEHADKEMPIDEVFQLMEIRVQSERSFELAEAGFGFEERHVEFPESDPANFHSMFDCPKRTITSPTQTSTSFASTVLVMTASNGHPCGF
jgi:hypothetical protein